MKKLSSTAELFVLALGLELVIPSPIYHSPSVALCSLSGTVLDGALTFSIRPAQGLWNIMVLFSMVRSYFIDPQKQSPPEP